MPIDHPITSVPMNALSRAIERDRPALEAAFSAVLDSGYVILGPQHAAFEKALAALVGVDHAVGVATGTDALELAMRALMPDDRSTVLVAANAGGYSSTAARRAGFSIVYADVDPTTHCLSAETVAAALTPEVGIVVVTHLYGLLTDLTDLVELCRARGVRLIEDCAQAIGAHREGRQAGSWGDAGTISFYPTKNLGAIGDGGAIVTDDAATAARVRQLRQYGWADKYSIEIAGGTNSRLDELQAAFLLTRLPLLDGFNERRREIIARYVEAAEGTPIQVLPADSAAHVGHLAVAVSSRRDELRAALAAVGVATDIHFPIPDHRQPGLAAAPVSLPVTEALASTVFSLPCFPELTDDEIEFVCAGIRGLA